MAAFWGPINQRRSFCAGRHSAHRIIVGRARLTYPDDPFAQGCPPCPVPGATFQGLWLPSSTDFVRGVLLQIRHCTISEERIAQHVLLAEKWSTCGTFCVHVPDIPIPEKFFTARSGMLACLLLRQIRCCFHLHHQGEFGFCL